MRTILFIFISLLISCTDLDDIAYDQFSLYKQFQYSGQIRTDGEYWAYDSINGGYEIICLYRDGSMFRSGTEVKNNDTKCDPINDNVRDVGWWWGFFDIEGKEILFQTVDATSINGHSKYQVFNFDGQFINETTFTSRITNTINNTIEESVFHFRQCTSKPDSMNVILRNIGK